ncbi:putative CFEM domain-containing protein [Rosellinia necatrix]|uniref:Putative CFEM domain-containing protein n=1 Tax=Rosellinia necatrix TaxID=77044 RepID=A0A1W2TLS6_ROSNE|nr:putative CFEM domain-containing protein [Rosellinia necatrix]
MGVLDVRRPPHQDVTKIPTPPLQAAALFINFFLPALALAAVAMRLYARHMLQQLSSSDWLLLAALLFALAMVAPFYFYIKLNYFGWRAVDVPVFDAAPGLWWFYLAQIFYNPVLALVKASVLIFLLRLGGHQQKVRYFIYGILTFNGLQAVAVFLVAVFQCIPISANWDSEVAATATCINPSFHVIISAITLVTDLLVLIIPFWIFLGLKLPLAARLAIIGAFVTGLGVTIIGGVRVANIYKLFFGATDPNEDPYYNIGITLNAIEINLAIVSGAVPGLRPLFRKWFPNLFGGSSGKYTNDGGRYKSNDYTRGTGLRNGGGGGGGGESGLAHGHGGIGLKNLSRTDRHTEIRSTSPSGSEEEIMTSNGIMRTTDVHIHYGSGTSLHRSSSPTSSDFKVPAPATAPNGL